MESKLKQDESVLVSRVKRQLVGSERCGHHHRYRNLYHHHNHYHSGSESVISIILVDVILLGLISGLSSTCISTGIFCRYKEDWDDGREGRAYGYYRYRDDPRFILMKL